MAGKIEDNSVTPVIPSTLRTQVFETTIRRAPPAAWVRLEGTDQDPESG